jgi:hypothetical protein
VEQRFTACGKTLGVEVLKGHGFQRCGTYSQITQGFNLRDCGSDFSAPNEPTYFLNRFSNAVRASMGRAELGVEVSFSTRTRME